MSDEQRVRTMAGWIGVEISRSRVRTPGKAGYGLYRVRGQQLVRKQVSTPAGTTVSDPYWAGGTWTAYAFTLEEIEAEVEVAIGAGRPEGPSALILRPADKGLCDLVTVPTRWTSTYRGRRDLGVSGAERSATRALGAQLEMDTPRSRQRAQNAAFQREHKARRDWGLKRRHARKEAHNARIHNTEEGR